MSAPGAAPGARLRSLEAFLQRLSPFLPLLVLLAGGIACAHLLGDVYRPYRFLKGDGSFYFGVSRHLYEAGTLEQHGNHPASWYELEMGWNHSLDAGWSNIALAADGERWYPKHPLLLPVLALPFVYAFGPLGAFAFNLLICALLLLATTRLGDALGGPLAGLAGGLVLALSPVFAEQSYSFSNDVLQALLVIAAADAALRDRARAAGALLGLSALAKLTSVLLLPAFALLYLLRRDRQGALAFAAAAALGLGALALVDWILFGAPWITGYQRILVREAGRLTLHAHTTDFAPLSELWRHLVAIATGPGGLWRRVPYLLLSPLGLLALAGRRRLAEATFLAALIAPPVLFHAGYRWYRIAFLLPAIAAAAALAGQLLVAFGAPKPRASRLRLRPARAYLALSALLLLGGGLHRLLAEPPRRLSERIREARAGQGEIPCDYFNNQSWQWECSGFDRGDDRLMTGPAVARPLRAGGALRSAIRLTPRGGGRARWIAYPLGAGRCTLHLEHGLEDGSRGRAWIEVLVDGRRVARLASRPGWQAETISLPEGEEVRLEARGTPRAPLGIDGEIVCPPASDGRSAGEISRRSARRSPAPPCSGCTSSSPGGPRAAAG